jgi:hypothetical protein
MSEYFVKNVDLDLVFKPRITTKRGDVGYSINGVDISNKYEKTANDFDQLNYNTNIRVPSSIFSGRYRDLRYLFQSYNAYFIRATLYTSPETKKKYKNFGDGQVSIYLQKQYLKPVGGYYKIRFTVDGGRATTINEPIGDINTLIFFQYTYVSGNDGGQYYGGSGNGNHYIGILDVNSGVSTNTLVNVAFSSPSQGPYYTY